MAKEDSKRKIESKKKKKYKKQVSCTTMVNQNRLK